MTTYLQKLRLFSRDVRLYLLSVFLVAFASDGIRTVLFNLYLLRLGYGPDAVGVVNGVGALTFGLLSLPAGAWGRRHSSRRALGVGTALMAAGFALLPLAEALPAPWRMSWLLLTSVLANLGVALYYVNNMPFLADATGPAERYHAFSVEMALVPLAGFAGALAGGLLPGLSADLLGLAPDGLAAYRYPLLLTGVLVVPAVLALAATSRTGEARRDEEDPRLRGRAPYGLIVVMVVVAVLRFAARGAVTTFFNVYMDASLGAPTNLIGAVTAMAQLLAVPAALMAPFLVGRFGKTGVIVWGVLGSALSMLPLALIPTWAGATVGYVGTSTLFFVTTAPIRVFTQEVVPPRWRTAMSGALVMGVGLSLAGVAFGGGVAIASLGFASVFLAAAGLAAAGAVLFAVCFRERSLRGRRG